jgi:predicted neuraminidase
MNQIIDKPALLAEVSQGRVECFIPTPCVQNHASFIHPLPGGALGCVWFGGTQEGIPDISVHFSRLEAGATRWSDAVKLSDDPTRSEQNPLLFTAPDGALWLLWTAQLGGNQDTALVRRRISRDGGLSWGPIATLIEEMPGYGTFIRSRIVVNAHGEWLLPIWRCKKLR